VNTIGAAVVDVPGVTIVSSIFAASVSGNWHCPVKSPVSERQVGSTQINHNK